MRIFSNDQRTFWRLRDGAAWAARTETTKFLQDNQKKGAEGPELYDMAADPYESTDIINASPEKRAAMAKLWNDWNAENIANVFLQASEYQKKRIDEATQELRKNHEK